MHVHASYVEQMRTTIEITDEQRSKLLAIAASRGMKGFSGLVQQALDEYLARLEARRELVEEALTAMGSLDDGEAADLSGACADLRGSWR